MVDYLERKLKIRCKNLDLSFGEMLKIIDFAEGEGFNAKGGLNLCTVTNQYETLIVSKTVKEQSVKYTIIKE